MEREEALDRDIGMKKLKEYVKSIPVRIVFAVIIFAVASAIVALKDPPPLPVDTAKEEPKAGSQNLLNAYQDSTDTVLRVMSSRPADAGK